MDPWCRCNLHPGKDRIDCPELTALPYVPHPALQDLALGRLDAVMTSVTTAQAFIDAGNPVKIAGDPLFGEPLAVAFDKDSELDNSSLVEAVDQIVADMHSDGTLTQLSEEWYGGIDVTQVS